MGLYIGDLIFRSSRGSGVPIILGSGLTQRESGLGAQGVGPSLPWTMSFLFWGEGVA